MATVTMTLEEYEAMLALIRNDAFRNSGNALQEESPRDKKTPKRSTAYQRRYKKAFKSVSKRFKLKSGKWKKGGFKAAVRAAHKEAKR